MLLPMIAPILGKVIDRIIPDKAAQAKAQSPSDCFLG